MAPVNFLEYGKSYGSRLYGKTPSKYLIEIEFKLNVQFNIVLTQTPRRFVAKRGKFFFLQDILSPPKHVDDLFAE